MIYADTDVLLSLFCPDSLSVAAAAWYADIAGPVCISPWSVIEFRANMGLRARKGLLARPQCLAVMKQFDAAASANFHLLAPAQEHFLMASEWLAKTECALRAGDALHLAIAFGHRCEQFVSFDQPLGAAAKKLGLPFLTLKAQ
ncbi:MAG: type II toxin-antitoxin system VapC family toxin [Burkholderiales bacterium]